MRFISHRGNLYGPDEKRENEPDYILDAIKNGVEVEVDVWIYEESFYLGHEYPKYKIDLMFLLNPALWIHAKDIKTLNNLIGKAAHIFFHQTDAVTLTSLGYLWTYVGQPLYEKSIAVLPTRARYSIEELSKCSGVCSDHIMKYKGLLK